MIEFKPGRYFIGIWYASNGKEDWMAGVYRDAGESRWQVRYRFRYYNSEDAWDNKDEKNWYAFSGEDTESGIERAVHKLAGVVQLRYDKLDFVAMHSDDPMLCVERLKERPWAHARISEDPKKWSKGGDVGGVYGD